MVNGKWLGPIRIDYCHWRTCPLSITLRLECNLSTLNRFPFRVRTCPLGEGTSAHSKRVAKLCCKLLISSSGSANRDAGPFAEAACPG